MNKLVIIFIIIIFFFRQLIFADTENNTYINTSNITYDEKNNIIELAKNSKININDSNILVDRGIIDYDNNKIEVFGNFYLYQELNMLSGKDLKGDTTFDNFEAKNVSYIYNNDLKIDSDKAKKSKNLISFYNNFLTPCELDGYFNCPTWSLRIDKTEYDIEEDKFIHFDSFLQIADYKIFYIPYLSHYGTKAPRKKGFLTPTFDFAIGGTGSIITPYYLPVKNNTNLTITPKFSYSEDSDIFENYEVNTSIKHKKSGGEIEMNIFNEKSDKEATIFSSAKLYTKQTINKNTNLSVNALITNSISTTRSNNKEPITFEDIYIRLDRYNYLKKDDFMKIEFSTVESFDSTNISFIPISPSLKYVNQISFSNNLSSLSEIEFGILKRDESQDALPSENIYLKMSNDIGFNKNLNGNNSFNKITFLNNFSNNKFEHNSNLNKKGYRSSMIFSSDNLINLEKNITPRIKLVHHQDISHEDSLINEDSSSITFNYQNNYSDNRLFGLDKYDNSSRIIYGMESEFDYKIYNLNLNINQVYEFKKNNNYTKLINQNDNFSDFAIELKTEYEDIIFQIDSRIDKDDGNKKEMNYSLNLDKFVNLNLIYNETSKDAFSNLSDDTQSLGIKVSKNLNNNIALSFNSNVDLKNKFSPYSESFGLSFFDECSRLNIIYSNSRFNDNYNTTPEEKISVVYYMDYLGFFGYEQSTDLFFKETGKFSNELSQF